MNINDHPVNRFKRPIYFYLFCYALVLPLYIIIGFDYFNQVEANDTRFSTEKAFWFGTCALIIVTAFMLLELLTRKGRKWLFSVNRSRTDRKKAEKGTETGSNQ